ncbi:RecQ family ATP-dependent DNA helicase [Priestia abyssalis]|uniref:RecQ family ATP-dependent DNA helicase n=1 Tax=Priestia abyssalis TaxID=1221450 RepID=UPI0009953BE0|nr:ATP-dependent DNA helicase RecQ [Priestia abyssalis]
MSIEEVLRRKFGHSHFRLGQREVIETILREEHVVTVLPTGTGKSLCYQLPAYVQERPVLVVSPLLSLMEDQVQQLKASGEKRVIALNSFLSRNDKQQALQQLGSFRFIYVSPEILQNPFIIEALKKANIGLFVVDEAHCISQWGHDFRLDYLHLGDVWVSLGKPTCLALTATATEDVIEDIITQLKLPNVHKLIYSVDRPNIALQIKQADDIPHKKELLLEYVKTLKTPGIIYCSSRMWTEALALLLKENGIENVAYYHGGMEPDQRMLIQHQFLQNQLDVICCTSAFGMGINKSDIRFVIHFHLPTQMEAYLQETGRAGRDGNDSLAVLLYNEADDELAYSLMEMELPHPDVIKAALMYIQFFKEKKPKMMELTSLEKYLLQAIRLDEVHWRFIRYHLEKNGVINGSMINADFDADQLYRIITRVALDRVKRKQEKFQAVKQVVGQSGCRRERILSYFNQEMEGRPANCCDQCGIELSHYQKTKYEKNKQGWEFKGWKEELASLLRQSE